MSILEELKNRLKTAEWQIKKQEQDALGGNPNAVDAYDMYDDRIPNVKSIEGVPVDEIDWNDPRAFMERLGLGKVSKRR